MPSILNDHAMIVDTGRSDAVWTVAFHPDGMHFLSGNGDGVRRWRIVDGQEVGKHTGMNLNTIAVSRDHKWIVCGAQRGASVWDAEKEEMVVEVESKRVVAAVDISPDSSRFATGTGEVSVWSITTGQRLVGPLEHDNDVRGLKFSPNGGHIATAYEHGDIRVFDSHNGDQLIAIKTIIPSFYPITPLAWSNNGERIFATSTDNKVKSFDVSTGSQLAESPVLGGGTVESIALAGNGKFIATFASRSISFLDTSTLAQIGPAIEDSEDIRSIALSPHSTHLATAQYKGKVAVRNLASVLPDSYGPFHDDQRQDAEQTSTLGGPDDERPDSNPEGSGVESEIRSEDGDDDLLDLELPSSTPKPLFNYDEPPSPTSSTHPSEGNVSPLVPIPQPSDVLPAISSPGGCPEGNTDIINSPEDAPVRKRWLQTFQRRNKDPASRRDRPSIESRRPVLWSRRQSPTNVNANNARFSVMAEGRRQPRTVGKSIAKPQRKKPSTKAAIPSNTDKETSRSEQEPADPKKANSSHPLHDASQLVAKAISVTHQPESGKATISLTLPAWMLCFRSGAEDGMH